LCYLLARGGLTTHARRALAHSAAVRGAMKGRGTDRTQRGGQQSRPSIGERRPRKAAAKTVPGWEECCCTGPRPLPEYGCDRTCPIRVARCPPTRVSVAPLRVAPYAKLAWTLARAGTRGVAVRVEQCRVLLDSVSSR